MNGFEHILFDRVLCFKSLLSTQTKAEELIKAKQIQGNFLLIAETQTGGKGRGKNSWWSPRNGLWFTAGLYGLDIGSNLSIFTGICLHKAISVLLNDQKRSLKIKWPNDIYYQEYKLAGILCGHLGSHRYHLLGIGVNTNIDQLPPELDDPSVSLHRILGHKIDHDTLLKEFWDLFADALPAFIEQGLDPAYYSEISYLLNKEVSLNTEYQSFRGIARGINRSGALLLELESGLMQPFYAGSVIRTSPK